MKIEEIPSRRLSDVFLSVADLVLVVDREGVVSDLRAREDFPVPLPREGAAGRPLEEVLPEDLAAALRARMDRGPEGEGRLEWEMEGEEERFFEVSLVPIDGKHFLVLVSDVSPCKRSNLELLRSKNFLQNIFDGLRDGLNILDTEFNILKANYWMRMKYPHVDQFEGRKCYEVYQRRDSVCPWCPSEKTLRTGQPAVAVVPYVTDEGWKGWMELSTFPLRDENGKLIGVIEDCKDITERIRIEENLRRLATAVEQSNEGIVICDPKGEVQYVNPGFEEMTGYSQEDLKGLCPLFDLLEDVREELASAIREGSSWRGRSTLVRRDGKEITVDVSLSLVKDDQGQVRNLVTLIQDVTQNVLLEKQLSRAQKMEAIGRLAGGIAHDFNNILTAVVGYSELLMMKLGENHPARKYAEYIHSSLKRATALTEKLLTFSKKRPHKIDVFDLNQSVREILPLIQRLAGGDISISLHLPEEPVKIQGDPLAVEQILVNLVLNSAEAIEGRGHIDIAVETDEQGVRIVVRDDGHGIPPEDLDKIFDPFYSTKETGTGLGLYVVYNLVQQFKGRIEVESTPGQGTTFTVFLPYRTSLFEA